MGLQRTGCGGERLLRSRIKEDQQRIRRKRIEQKMIKIKTRELKRSGELIEDLLELLRPLPVASPKWTFQTPQWALANASP
ncbi:hypothetical protein PIB30_030705 [Stylosanthes scabra]|uniref:Uncharacterized protein n=1 Tax=Stylosanthes scabra TaxID=79078 RepID=A0ABU6TBW3_9FABA|nr:hypothetical protein [Stylosanthes scabra]